MATVLVVGAGPTGLALACGLHAAGVPARIVDAAPGPATTSRALGLQPRGLEVLDRLGALGDLPERGLALRAVVINVDGREITRLRVGGTTRLVKRPGVSLSQADIEAALRTRLADLGGAVEWGQRVTDPEGADWIVGCDGAHSQIRKAAGIGFPGVPLIERFLLADVHASLPIARDEVWTWLHADEMIALFPLPGADLWRVLVPQPAGIAEELEPADRIALITRLLAERTGFPAAAVTGCEWTSSFRIHRRLAETYRHGRLLLAGDAAHIHSPMGGQGMNTGLGDAENLAWKLALVATGRAGEELLDTYEAERRPIATEVLGNTSAMTRLMLGGSPARRLVRDHLLVPLMNRAYVQRLIWESSSQLKITYRHGPLGVTGPAFGRAPLAGDRVPTDRLPAPMRGRWGLLTSDDTTAAMVQDRLGAGSVVRRRHSGPTLLVRPDGHLAARGHAVAGWLDRALGAPRRQLVG